eukprot:gb/GEZN01000237.1/.p1 GENE.gb/GEZN01000237.1/~~gb/GEZN01000237.1/.p1  ORF type:complete len:1535 (-),score=327.23 gb/GEZN01000237.1/:683-5287(-)
MSKKKSAPKFMGRALKVDGEEKIVEAIEELMSDTSPSTWVILNYVMKGKVGLLQTGPGVAEAFYSLLKPDEVFYILYKYSQAQAGGYAVNKIAFITFVGKEVKGIIKASVGPQKNEIQPWLAHMTALGMDIQADSIENLAHQLGSAATSPGGSETSTEAAPASPSAPTTTVQAAGDDPAAADQNAGGTTCASGDPLLPVAAGMESPPGSPGPATDSLPKMVSPLSLNPVPSSFKNPLAKFKGVNLKVQREEEIGEATSALCNEFNPVTWFLLEYVSKKDIALTKYGTGGLEEEILPLLKPEAVVFVCYHYSQATEVGHTNKLAFITWIGQSVKAMTKAGTGPQRTELFAWLTKAMTFGIEVQESTTASLLFNMKACLSPMVLKRSFEQELKQEEELSLQATGDSAPITTQDGEDNLVTPSSPPQRGLRSPGLSYTPSYEFTPRKRTAAQKAKLLSVKPWRGIQMKIPDAAFSILADAMQEVTDETANLTWLIISFVGDARHKIIECSGTGEGNADQWTPRLLEDQVAFVLYHYNAGKTNKLCFVSWIGHNCKSLIKAAAGPQRAEMMAWLKSMVSLGAEYQVEKLSDLLHQMGGIGGTPLKVKQEEEAVEDVNNEDQINLVNLNGFLVPRYPGPLLRIDRPIVGQAIKDLTQKTSDISWVLLHFTGRTTVSVSATGEGNVVDELSRAGDGEVEFSFLERQERRITQTLETLEKHLQDKEPRDGASESKTGEEAKASNEEEGDKKEEEGEKKESKGPRGFRNDEVMFLLSAYDQKQSGQEVLVKFAFTTWIGPHVKSMSAAAVGAQKLELLQWLSKMMAFQVEYQCSSVEEWKRLAEATINTKPDWARERQKGGGQDSTCQFSDPKEMRKGWKEMNKAGSDVDWIMYGYDPEKEGGIFIKTVAQGKGEVSTWKDRLQGNNVLFSLQRVFDRMQPNVVKAVYIPWIGEQVGTWDKAKATGHIGYLYDYFKRHAVSVSAVFQPDTPDELTHENMMAKLLGGGGATEKEATLKTEVIVKGGAGGGTKQQQEEERKKALEERLKNLSPEQLARYNELKEKNQASGKSYIGPYLPVDFQGKKEVKDALELLRNGEVDYVTMSLSGKESRDVSVEYPISKDKEQASSDEAASLALINTVELEPLSDAWKASGTLALDRILVHVLAFNVVEEGYASATVRKLVFLQWLGPTVSHRLKAEAQQLNPSLVTFATWALKKLDVTVAVTAEDEIAGMSEQILQKLTGSRMAGGVGIASGASIADNSKYAELKKRASQLTFDKPEEFVTSVMGVARDEDPLTWCLFVYAEGSIDVLTLKGKGEGRYPWDEYKKLLDPKMSGFLLHRVVWGNKELAFSQTINNEKPYLGLVRWQGKEIAVMEKALSSHHWFTFTKKTSALLRRKDFFLYGGYFHVEDFEDLAEDRILKHMRLDLNNEEAIASAPSSTMQHTRMLEAVTDPIVVEPVSFVTSSIKLSGGSSEGDGGSSSTSTTAAAAEEQEVEEEAGEKKEMTHVKRVGMAGRRAATKASAPKFAASGTPAAAPAETPP